MSRDTTPCQVCRVPAFRHLSDAECRGFVAPSPSLLRLLADLVADSAMALLRAVVR